MQIRLNSFAQRFLRKTTKETYLRIMMKIKQLAKEPFPADCKRIFGNEKTFRVRVGNFRILYAVFNEENEVLIVDIDKRGKIYTKHKL